MMRPNPKIVVGTPCYGGLVTQRYMQCLTGLMQHGLGICRRGLFADQARQLLSGDSLCRGA